MREHNIVSGESSAAPANLAPDAVRTYVEQSLKARGSNPENARQQTD